MKEGNNSDAVDITLILLSIEAGTVYVSTNSDEVLFFHQFLQHLLFFTFYYGLD